MSEREQELMEDLFVATREANNDGVSKVRIASMLAYMSAGATDPSALDTETVENNPDAQDLEERLSPSDDSEPALCPLCKREETETRITDVQTQIGGQLRVVPCGHEVEWENRDILGNWLEDIENNLTS